jgi:hypothetical protein
MGRQVTSLDLQHEAWCVARAAAARTYSGRAPSNLGKLRNSRSSSALLTGFVRW